jgi:hypothetical protein
MPRSAGLAATCRRAVNDAAIARRLNPAQTSAEQVLGHDHGPDDVVRSKRPLTGDIRSRGQMSNPLGMMGSLGNMRRVTGW